MHDLLECFFISEAFISNIFRKRPLISGSPPVVFAISFSAEVDCSEITALISYPVSVPETCGSGTFSPACAMMLRPRLSWVRKDAV